MPSLLLAWRATWLCSTCRSNAVTSRQRSQGWPTTLWRESPARWQRWVADGGRGGVVGCWCVLSGGILECWCAGRRRCRSCHCLLARLQDKRDARWHALHRDVCLFFCPCRHINHNAHQETEAAVDATISKVLLAVEPLEAAWRAELQRLQVRRVEQLDK